MKLRHLETFIIVAEELHFGRAAARLHVAQPAVSQTIRNLEDHLQVQLFDRTRRQIELTEPGRMFLSEAKRILSDLDTAVNAARQIAAGERGRLRIGFSVACAVSFIPSAITAFMLANPQVDVSLSQLGTAAQIEALKLGHLDVGFSVLTQPEPLIEQRLIAPDRLCVFLPKHHPLTQHQQVEVSQALSQPFILMAREQEPWMHQAFHKLCQAHHVTPNVILEVDHLEAMLAFVAAGLGVSFAPQAAASFKPHNADVRPLNPHIDVNIHALWPTHHLNPTAERLLRDLTAPSEP